MCFFSIYGDQKNIIATPISNTDRTLRLRKFCAPCWLNLEKTKNQKTSRKPKNQKTKTFQRMFGLRLMFGFFLVFLEFFCFFLVMTLKKLKKTQGFFWFFAWIVFTCLLKICPKNQKRPEFFWFFGLLQVRVPSKNQKKP